MVIVIRLIEVAAALTLVALAFTQVILPLFLNTRIFPMFRRKNRVAELERKIADARSELEEERLLEEIEQTQDKTRIAGSEAELDRVRRQRMEEKIRRETEKAKSR